MNNNRTLLLFTMLVIFNNGCSLQPRYEKPKFPVMDHWEQKNSSINKALNWESFFADRTLKKLIKSAIENNRDLRIAILNIQSAKAQFQIERSALFPSINFNGNETIEHLPGKLYSTRNSGAVTYHQSEVGIGITSWELDFFGKTKSLRDVALENYLSTQASTNATQISLITEVVSGYLTLCANNDLLQLSNRTVENYSNSLKLIQKRYALGISNELDTRQAETDLKNAEANVVKYSRQVSQDANALKLLVGADLPDELITSASLNKDWHFPNLDAGVPSDLLTRRPDIIAAEHALKAANANIGAARAAFFPSISLTAFGGTASDSLGNLFHSGTGEWSFKPSINIPIFDGGKNQANLNIALLSRQIEVANYEKAIQKTFKEVADSLVGRATYKSEFAIREQATKANNRYLELSQMRFDQGVDSYLNVLIAQRSLYQSQQEQIGINLAFLNEQIVLYKVLGGGWNGE